jgi:hypothetical protein
MSRKKLKLDDLAEMRMARLAVASPAKAMK